MVSRIDFAQRHWIDRLVGYGVALHEGAFFGIANQLLGTLTALLLVVLSVSGAVLWWRRRPIGLLGAPIPLTRPRFGGVLIAAIVALGFLSADVRHHADRHVGGRAAGAAPDRAGEQMACAATFRNPMSLV